MRQHLIELVLFSTYAELRAERARSYLGLIWWVLEPALMMGTFWLVFDVIMKSGGPGYLPSLLIGLTLWQWMKSCMTHGGYAIWSNLGLVRQVHLPPLVFPIVAMLSDTVKFFYIFALLVVILWIAGYPPNMAYLALPPLFVAVLLFAAGVGFVIAAVVPLLPDLRFVIEQVLTVVMFLSGVVFSLGNVPSPLREIMALNPVAVIMDASRGILMRGEWPNWVGLGKVTLISIAACLIGAAVVARLAPRYPKLAT
ncbi:MAG: ABC transporter permease [Rhodanobacteraceae bacterium]|jgi:lipopolysaccharide transport system permease protein|nr:ABC transporter permease [Rhodanobacteraceae bacterium]